MKRIASVFLALITILSCFTSAFAYTQKYGIETEYPTVYLHGQGSEIRARNNDTNTYYFLYPPAYDTGAILDQINLLHGPFAKGIVTGNWDDWCDTFVDIICPLFESYSLDESGNSKVNTYFWNSGETANRKRPSGKFDLLDFSYNYDWRIDPYETADALAKHIDKVLKMQKVSKVNLLGRCIGGNVVLAYLDRYGSSKINKVMFYCEGFEGFEIVGRLFTGDVNIDADALTRFIDDYFTDEDYAGEEIYGLLVDLVNILNKMKTLDVAVDALTGVYDKVYENVVPRVLLRSFGTMPSFWALISDEYFEEAKEFVFGEDTETYSVLIEKIDDFHYNCLDRYEEIIEKTIESGTPVYNVTKYGYQIAPLVDNTEIQSDSMLELWSASAGATCSPVNGAFTQEYLTAAGEAGKAEYLSPDRQIDASTCLLPDRTWFIKNMTHMYMPDTVHVLAAAIFDYDGDMTVSDDENYPQFLLYTKADDTLLPLTEENSDTKGEWKKNFFQRVWSFWKRIGNILREYIGKLFEKEEKPEMEPAAK